MRDPDKYIPEVEEVELELLLEGVRKVHGVDLSDRGVRSLRRAVWSAMQAEKVATLSGLQEKLLHDPEAWARFQSALRAPRGVDRASPGWLALFRREIVPRLKTYPFIRVWQAGCGSAFETYALSIIFLEEGVYEKSTIYNTDPDALTLTRSQDGLFPMQEMRDYLQRYAESGGEGDFRQYCFAGEESATFDAGLRRNMVFAQHDFATDGSFNEFNAILCRKPLRGMKPSIRTRAERTLCESLVTFGMLALPGGESLEGMKFAPRFEKVHPEHNLYRKIA